MSTHTPGTWCACGDEVYSSDCEFHPVAVCTPNSTCRENDEAIANARLIAAAPDLLETLNELTELVRSKWGAEVDAVTSFSEIVEAAEAAIAKAEGR